MVIGIANHIRADGLVFTRKALEKEKQRWEARGAKAWWEDDSLWAEVDVGKLEQVGKDLKQSEEDWRRGFWHYLRDER